MIKQIQARGVDGGLDVTEVDGVPLTAVETKMLAECTDDARDMMTALATQRKLSLESLGDANDTRSPLLSSPVMVGRIVPEEADWNVDYGEPSVQIQDRVGTTQGASLAIYSSLYSSSPVPSAAAAHDENDGGYMDVFGGTLPPPDRLESDVSLITDGLDRQESDVSLITVPGNIYMSRRRSSQTEL